MAQLLDAIQAGDSEAGNALVHQIIRHPMWGIAPKVLWQLAVDNYRSSDWLQSLLTSQQPELKDIGDWFVWLAGQAANQPLAITLEYMIGLRHTKDYSSPLKNYFVDGNAKLANQYFHSLSAIQLLRALVHDFAKTNEPTLAELIRFIEINRVNGLVVADESPFITGGHAVQLLTVHKAKGLEFDAVYIIDAVEDNWQPRAGGRRPPANLPLQPAGDDLDDYVRLMYVALTRAKSSITVSAYHLDHAGKDVALSPIIQSAFDVRRVTETDKSKLVEVLEENLRWPSLDGGQEQAILKARLETYSLSVTHLINFLKLEKGGPRYFKERNLLRLPEVKSVNLAYGTAMHNAMETAQKLVNKDTFKLAEVAADFSQALAAQQLARAEYQRFNKQGEQVLARLFNDYGYRLPKGSLPEQDLRDIRVGPARLRGKLDRVDLSGDSMMIIDYKTGKPLSSFETKDKNSVLKAHNQKLQLVFYALLTSQHPSFSQYGNVTGEMVYLEAEDRKQLTKSFTPSKGDIDRLKQLVAAVWQHVMDLDFPDTSRYQPNLDGTSQFEQDLIDGKI
jgi:ATP-dependent exoDNAse (exonuclease V) beta subunit